MEKIPKAAVVKSASITHALLNEKLLAFLASHQQPTRKRAIESSCNRAQVLKADFYRQRRQDTVPPVLASMTDHEDHLRSRYEVCLEVMLNLLIAHPPQVLCIQRLTMYS